MRAVSVTGRRGARRLELVDRAPPRDPRRDELLVAVEAVSVNGTDLGLLGGDVPLAGTRLGPRPGFDVVGRVTAVGPRVTAVEVGDRVAALLPHSGGGMAEHVLVRQARVAVVPDVVAPVPAVSVVLAGLTALQALHGPAGLRARPGARVLVVGAAGGIGLVAVQLARLAGADVTALARGAKADRLRDLGTGAHVVSAAAEELAGAGERWDVVLDAPGALDPRRAGRLLREGGAFVSTRAVDPRLLPGSVLAALGRGPTVAAVRTAADPQEIAYLLRLVADGRLVPVVDRVLPLEQVARAAAVVRGAVGKVVLEVSGSATTSGAVHLGALHPGHDETVAQQLLDLQRAAYAVEAELIGDDRIPALHETLADLRRAPLSWVGAFDDGRLVGAVAWSQAPDLLDVERLVVAPGRHRRGTGTALVRHVLSLAGRRQVVVSTGRDNRPARSLYERLGFVGTGDVEVLPGLWVSRYRHP